MESEKNTIQNINEENKFDKFNLSYVWGSEINEEITDIGMQHSHYFISSQLNLASSLLTANDNVVYQKLNNWYGIAGAVIGSIAYDNYTKDVVACMDLIFNNVNIQKCIFSDMSYFNFNKNDGKYKEYCDAINYVSDGVYFYINNLLKYHLKCFITSLHGVRMAMFGFGQLKVVEHLNKIDGLVNIKNNYLNKLAKVIYDFGLYYNIKNINDNSLGHYYINSIYASRNNLMLNINKMIKNLINVVYYNKNNEKNLLTYELLNKILFETPKSNIKEFMPDGTYAAYKKPYIVFENKKYNNSTLEYNDIICDTNLKTENIYLYLDYFVSIIKDEKYMAIINRNPELLTVYTEIINGLFLLIGVIKTSNDEHYNLGYVMTKFEECFEKFQTKNTINISDIYAKYKSINLSCPVEIKKYLEFNNQNINKIPKYKTHGDTLGQLNPINTLNDIINGISGINKYIVLLARETGFVDKVTHDIERVIYKKSQTNNRYIEKQTYNYYNVFGVFDIVYKYIYIWLHIVNIEHKCKIYREDIKKLNKTLFNNLPSSEFMHSILKKKIKNIPINYDIMDNILKSKYTELIIAVNVYQSKFNAIVKDKNIKIDTSIRYPRKHNLYIDVDDVNDEYFGRFLELTIQEYYEWKSIIQYIINNNPDNVGDKKYVDYVKDIKIKYVNNVNEINFFELISSLNIEIGKVSKRLKTEIDNVSEELEVINKALKKPEINNTSTGQNGGMNIQQSKNKYQQKYLKYKQKYSDLKKQLTNKN